MSPLAPRSRSRLAHPVLMVTVIVATVVVALGLVFIVGAASGRGGPPPAVATEAGPRVQQLLSYAPETIESDLPQEETYLVGDYRTEYVDLITDVLAPQSVRGDVSVEATVVETAVVDATEDTMVVLVLADLLTTRGEDPGVPSTGRFRVTLQNVDDDWLIAGLDVI